MAIRARLAERRSFKDRCMWAPVHRAKISVSSFSRGCSIGPKSSAKRSCYSPRNAAQSSMAIQAGLTERRLFKDRCMCGPGNWKKVQEISVYQHSSTYRVRSNIRDKLRVIDRDIGAAGIDCTSILKKAKLDVPPRNIERKFKLVLFPE